MTKTGAGALLDKHPPSGADILETVFQQTVHTATASLFLTNAFSPLLLCYKGWDIFINCGKIISYLTLSIESFHETHFWPCIIQGVFKPHSGPGRKCSLSASVTGYQPLIYYSTCWSKATQSNSLWCCLDRREERLLKGLWCFPFFL